MSSLQCLLAKFLYIRIHTVHSSLPLRSLSKSQRDWKDTFPQVLFSNPKLPTAPTMLIVATYTILILGVYLTLIHRITIITRNTSIIHLRIIGLILTQSPSYINTEKMTRIWESNILRLISGYLRKGEPYMPRRGI